MVDFSARNFDGLETFFDSETGDGSSGSPLVPRSAIRFSRNGSLSSIVLDTSTPANNRALPTVLLSGDASAIISPATSGNQVTANTTLNSLDTKIAYNPTTITEYRNTALSSTKQQIKGSAGNIFGWNFINPNSNDVYIKIYNAPSASVTVGTTTPILTLQIPASGFFFQDVQAVPQLVCSSGITIACVIGLADNITTAPSLAIHGSVRYI